MTFAISKLVGTALAPGTVLMVLLALSLLWQRSRPKAARALLAVAFALVAALNLCPLSKWLAGPLEARFPARPPPADVYGIVILGGAIDPVASERLGHVSLDRAAERMTEAVALARRFPQARLLFSGGSGLLLDRTDAREADAARRLFESMGLGADRVLYERDSRNTWENAVFSRRLANPQAGQVWLLVTSAWHMPRAMGCFRKAGWNVQAHPVDFAGAGSRWAGFEPGTELSQVALAEKEWIGLLAYHLLGRTDAWFPRARGAAVQ
ncbi:MAG: YdcF family protein [Nevskia sp.]|nr:YdcF family protein [Nevskia sp.]